MKKRTLAGSICALLLTALGTSFAAQASTEAILFTRTAYRAFDGAHGSVLYRVMPSGAGVARLASVVYGTDYLNASWSPSAASVVYEADVQGSNLGAYISAQLYVVDRQGGSPHRITTGTDLHTHPLWSPTSATIAFVDNGCLATVRADGTNQHIVFCAPLDQGEQGRPEITLARWTATGRSVLLVANGNEGGLEPQKLYSDVYRVNVSTGLATHLAQHVFENAGGHLAIAPDGSHGVYDGNPMQQIDFATNTLTPLPVDGFNAKYSPDGTKLAFFRQQSTSPYYTNIFVMQADGSHVRALTHSAPYVAYRAIADWSCDSTRVLVNRVADDRWLQIINVSNAMAVNVTKGTALDEGWYHP